MPKVTPKPTYQRQLAGLATPLVISVHTVVSFDFAVSQLPGWHATLFPPYFVDGASEVKKLKDTPLNYKLLVELNTEPRTTYLAAVRNPNPELGPPGGKEAEHHGH